MKTLEEIKEDIEQKFDLKITHARSWVSQQPDGKRLTRIFSLEKHQPTKKAYAILDYLDDFVKDEDEDEVYYKLEFPSRVIKVFHPE